VSTILYGENSSWQNLFAPVASIAVCFGHLREFREHADHEPTGMIRLGVVEFELNAVRLFLNE